MRLKKKNIYHLLSSVSGTGDATHGGYPMQQWWRQELHLSSTQSVGVRVLWIESDEVARIVSLVVFSNTTQHIQHNRISFRDKWPGDLLDFQEEGWSNTRSPTWRGCIGHWKGLEDLMRLRSLTILCGVVLFRRWYLDRLIHVCKRCAKKSYYPYPAYPYP